MRYKVLKIAALLAYCLIMINGELIAIPLFICLFGWLFEQNSILQLFSLLALISLLVSLTSLWKNIRSAFIIEILLFILLLSPLTERLYSFPPDIFFKSFGFIILFSLFIVLYTSSVLTRRFNMRD